jgi:hypothetical protein
MISKIVFLSFLALSLTAFSSPQSRARVAADFYSAGQVIPEKLISLGHSEFGRLNLKTFIHQMKTVRLSVQATTEFDQADGSQRVSAHWHRDASGSSITVSQKMWFYTISEVKPSMALHEYLGALGYDDQNYNLSTSLLLLAEKETWKFLNDDQIRYVRNSIENTSNEVCEGGGVIGVGGGGDLIGPETKSNLLLSDIEDCKRNPSAENKQRIFDDYQGISGFSIEAHWQVN